MCNIPPWHVRINRKFHPNEIKGEYVTYDDAEPTSYASRFHRSRQFTELVDGFSIAQGERLTQPVHLRRQLRMTETSDI